MFNPFCILHRCFDTNEKGNYHTILTLCENALYTNKI